MLRNKNKMFNQVRICLLLLGLWLQTNLTQQVHGISSDIDIKNLHPYLINTTTGELLIEPQDYMDFNNIYTPNDTYRRQQTAQGKNYHLIKAYDFANYFKSDYWHYSNLEDLQLSAQPVANATQCANHLNWLERQINSSFNLFKSGEQHANLMSMVDSFGRPPAGTYLGRAHWLGSYYECKRIQVDMEIYERENSANGNWSLTSSSPSSFLKSRYCLGKVRDVDWPLNDSYVPHITYKVGLCLPESCETLSFASHRRQIERLFKFNLPDYYKSRMELLELYCLPDESSPIRSLSLSARIFLLICGIWLTLCLLATWLYSCYRTHQHDLHKMRQMLVMQETSVSDQLQPSGKPQNVENLLISNKLLVTTKLNHQLDPTNDEQYSEQEQEREGGEGCKLSLHTAWLNHPNPFVFRLLKAISITENMVAFQEAPHMLRQPNSSKLLRINLNALDAIKCLCCLMVVLGHIVFIHMQHLGNILMAIEHSEQVWPRLVIPFFNFVDTFFIISGLLTAYFVFKRFNKHTFAGPESWLKVTLIRLLRLSPVYLLVFWFIKTCSVYLGEGPLWDYGTDKHSIKGLCINDHWWKSLLYLGNWGTLQPLCILPAWSIIVDAQYSLLLPPILLLLFKRRKTAYVSLMVAVLASTANMTSELINQRAVRAADMAKIRLHVYPMISRFAADFYNSAKNRIAPVAIGLIGGHLLHLYETGTIRRWPWFMRGASFRLILLVHLFIFMLPTIGIYTNGPKSTHEPDMTIFILSNATIKPLWSLINTVLLLRLITDLRQNSLIARLMSHNIWHPLGKLCFASYLIHYEVIMYLLKSRHEGLVEPTISNMLREFSFALAISTIISYFIHILYEAPINNLIGLCLPKNQRKSVSNQDLSPINSKAFNTGNQPGPNSHNSKTTSPAGITTAIGPTEPN